jgi:metal-responsive CopG/Arc/MetJ family transcriptional regulator
MSREITVTIPETLQRELDDTWPESGVYTSRSEFIRHAIREKIDREEG